jgi:hypothetical protein
LTRYKPAYLIGTVEKILALNFLWQNKKGKRNKSSKEEINKISIS